MTKIWTLATATAMALTAAPALAEPVVVYANPATEHVSYADLDLGATAGKSALERRIRGAAGRVCDVGGNPTLEEFGLRYRCFNAAVSDGLGQMNRLIAARGSGASLAATAIVISSR